MGHAQLALVPRTKFEPIPDFAHLPDFLSAAEQAAFVEEIRVQSRIAFENDGKPVWYTPTMKDGTPFSVKVFCLGWNWSLNGYKANGRKIPDLWLETAYDAIARITGKYEDFRIQAALVSHYAPTAKLGLHRDRQEDYKLRQAGSPIITLSLGCAAEMQVRDERTADFESGKKGDLITFQVESGDCVIFHGRARDCEHSIKRIFPGTSPIPGFHVGRLSITFRQVQ